MQVAQWTEVCVAQPCGSVRTALVLVAHTGCDAIVYSGILCVNNARNTTHGCIWLEESRSYCCWMPLSYHALSCRLPCP